MSDFPTTLEKQFEQLFKSVEGWNVNALKRIGRRVKEISSLSHADLQALNNATIVEQDINAILNELAALTEQSAPEVVRIYSDALKTQHLENQPLYDYRNKPFIPFAENKPLQTIVKAYARTTLDTMVNLSMTKARVIGTVDTLGNFIPLERSFKDVLDKAVIAVSTGTGDFNSEMRDVVRQLGGSGMRIDYGGGVTRRVDSMVRQNLLWGAKQASVEYNEMIGEELDCDGIEIDWHSNPRPSHEFMQGKQYSLHGRKTIKDIVYEAADDALNALQDYGCLHYKTPVILGVSEPRYSPEELARLNAENKRSITIDGVTKSGYEWKQTMRTLERESRITKEQIELFNASGDKFEVSNLRKKLKAINERYYKVAEGSGIKAQPGRMAYTKGVAKEVDNSVKSGIIKNKGLAAKIGDESTPIHEEPKLLKNVDYNDKKSVMTELENFEREAIRESIETACVITKDGELWKCFGTNDRVFPDSDLKEKLYKAYVSHNHPTEETCYTFSKDDLQLFMDYELEVLRGCDDKYTYEFTKDATNIDAMPEDWMNFENFGHAEIISLSKEKGIGYRRWLND